MHYPTHEAHGKAVFAITAPGVEQFVSEHDTSAEAQDEADRLNELHDPKTYGSVREAWFHISGLKQPGSVPAGSILAGGTRR